jgi:hypothetical protein
MDSSCGLVCNGRGSASTDAVAVAALLYGDRRIDGAVLSIVGIYGVIAYAVAK